jgi:biopolymer transport protein TolQ
MSSFQRIGQTGMASLAVVAPGIAEALIATGVGLAAAIPATIAYNHFVAQIKRQELDLNNFAADFLNLAKRNFFRSN